MNVSNSTKLFATLAFAGLLVAPLSVLANEGPQHARPYLGVGIESKTAPDQKGVTLRDVSSEGPAGKAGLKAGDRIVKVGETEVNSFADLRGFLATHKPGDKVLFRAVRDGKEESYTVTLGDTPVQIGEPAPKTKAFLGVFTQELNAELKDKLGVKVDKGAVVAKVMPGSPAAAAGLQEHDVITHVGKDAVNTPEELREAIQNVGAGKEVVLKVVRGVKNMDIKVSLNETTLGGDQPKFFPGQPNGAEDFSGKLPSFFGEMGKVPQLEKRIQDLENRVKELEQKLNK